MKAVEIRNDLNTPRLYLDGNAVIPVLYSTSDFPSGRSITAQADRNIRAFSKNGIKLVHCDTCLHFGWRKQTEFDLAPILGEIRGVLYAEPEAKILLRLHVNPPYWWMRDNVDELIYYRDPKGDCQGIDNGEQIRLIQDDCSMHIRVSLASEKWISDASKKLTECVRLLSATPEGKHVFGVQVACGIYGEWHQFGVDVSRSMREKFADFLAKKYGSDEALREAWNDPSVTIETADFHPEHWQDGDLGDLRDPVRSARIIDAQTCIQESTIDAILHFCKVIKENWQGDVLTGAFYNYFIDCTGFGSQIVGHLMEETAYKSKNLIDFLCCPFPYLDNRKPDFAPLQRNLAESDRLNGVLRLTEMDQHPYGTESIPGGDPEKMDESVTMLRRNVLLPLISGMGVWYYDHRLTNDELYFKHGWWEHPAMQKEVGRLQKIAENYSLRTYKPVADVLFVCDTKSIFNCARFTYEPSAVFDSFARTGVMADYVYLSDLDKAEMDRYKTIVFMNAYSLNAEQIALIKKCTEGKQRVWLYAPAIAGESGLNVENIKDITGISAEIGEYYDMATTNGGEVLKCQKLQPNPCFIIRDAGATSLAKNDRGECVAAKKGDDWYFAYPMVNVELATEIVNVAGAHRYTKNGDPVVANGDLVMVCSIKGGKTALSLPNGKTVNVNAKPCTTYLFDAHSGKKLLK